MKTIKHLSSLAFTATLLLALVSTPDFLNAQVEITWHGGTPGQEHEWNCPRNWSANRVPGEFDSVRLPDRSSQGAFYPILKTAPESAVGHMRIESGAVLTLLPGAELIVDGKTTHASGIQLFGALKNDGKLVLRNIALEPIEVYGGADYHGNGKVVTDEASASVEHK